MATPLWNRWFGATRIEDHESDGSALLAIVQRLEADLREIDFEEVTLEDRILVVEQEVVWQVRCALARSRFDLALAIQRYGVLRIAQLRSGEPDSGRLPRSRPLSPILVPGRRVASRPTE